MSGYIRLILSTKEVTKMTIKLTKERKELLKLLYLKKANLEFLGSIKGTGKALHRSINSGSPVSCNRSNNTHIMLCSMFKRQSKLYVYDYILRSLNNKIHGANLHKFMMDTNPCYKKAYRKFKTCNSYKIDWFNRVKLYSGIYALEFLK